MCVCMCVCVFVCMCVCVSYKVCTIFLHVTNTHMYFEATNKQNFHTLELAASVAAVLKNYAVQYCTLSVYMPIHMYMHRFKAQIKYVFEFGCPITLL